MHGMLSVTVMLAAFAAIALVGGASAVWLFRAAAAAAGRSRPARPAGPPGAATGQDPGAAGTAGGAGTIGTAGGAGTIGTVGVQGEPADEADGTETDYPERTWRGAALTETAQPAGSAEHNGWTGPGDAAEPPGAGDVYDVYDVDNWPGAEDSGDGRRGPDGPGCRSTGLRGWPDTAKSLYSRGWPVMDGPPRGPDAERPGNGTDTGADTGVAGGPDAAPEEAAGAEPSVRPEGARVYVLGESRRPGR